MTVWKLANDEVTGADDSAIVLASRRRPPCHPLAGERRDAYRALIAECQSSYGARETARLELLVRAASG